SKIRVRVGSDLDKAADVLLAVPQIRDVQKLEDCLSVTLDDGKGDDGMIARALVRGGIAVLELVPEQLRLDDAFLQLTKGMVH
ncbi:MAG: hypothetical protein ACYS5V_11030, partial [Planctomycetota bacterium]